MASKKNNVTIREIGEKTFDLSLPRQKMDCHLRWEKGSGWVLDIFDSTKKNPDKAWIESTPFKGRKARPNWNEILLYLEGI